MYRIHAFLDDKLIAQTRLQHCPRTGDTVRRNADTYLKVTEVVWCLDESDSNGQRVNLRLEKIT